jgi:N-acetylglutamate synthase-like GNAT family acetyltransferase
LTTIRPIEEEDRDQLAALIHGSWGTTRMATRGRLLDVSQVPGFIAQDDAGQWLGVAGYEVEGPALEVVLLEAFVPQQGAGAALLAACVEVARRHELRRLWLITTNDNTDALRFYQRRGFVMIALHRDAVTRARETIKPEIGASGAHDIPIRDEIELELPHAIWTDFIERYAWPT